MVALIDDTRTSLTRIGVTTRYDPVNEHMETIAHRGRGPRSDIDYILVEVWWISGKDFRLKDAANLEGVVRTGIYSLNDLQCRRTTGVDLCSTIQRDMTSISIDGPLHEAAVTVDPDTVGEQEVSTIATNVCANAGAVPKEDVDTSPIESAVPSPK